MDHITGNTGGDYGATQSALEFLAFRLGGEEYGIEFNVVQELCAYDLVKQVADMPAGVKGIANLRGLLIPIVDMRLKFQLEAPHYDAFTLVVILNICDRMMGIVVDRVLDVLTFERGQIKPVTRLGSTIAVDYMLGIGTAAERSVILVDIRKFMASCDIGMLCDARA